MTDVGIALLLAGVVLLVAEAHLPTAGVVGVAGAAGIVSGTVLLVSGSGAGAALVVSAAVAAALATLAFVALATLKGAAVRRVRVHGGSEGLVGRRGVLREAPAPVGEVFVDGALWRARRAFDADCEGPLSRGDPVVVEGVDGLTLSVRKAEEWELTP